MVFSGTGTGGAYHAGALKALTQEGLRIDVVAGRGVGSLAALFAAVDLGGKLWEAEGIWRDRSHLGALYRWRWPWRTAAWLAASLAVIVALPALIMLVLAIGYPVTLVLQLVGGATGTAWSQSLVAWVSRLLDPAWYGLWIPRIVTLALLGIAVALVAWRLKATMRGNRRGGRARGGWQLFGPPLDGARVKDWVARRFWESLRGPASIPQPPDADLSQRYVELLSENIGQPGYRELMLVAHDLDARRDVVFALLADRRRGTYFEPPAGAGENRAAELVDLAGLGRHQVFDAVGGALSIPLMTEPATLRHPVESYWRGETHRISDRPGAIIRLLEELSAAGVEQLVVVSSDPAPAGPHALREVAAEPRAQAGEWLGSEESVAVRDALTALFDRFSTVFHVRPRHNPLGPFDFAGVYDPRSDRAVDLVELVERGYEDAYRQVLEHVTDTSDVDSYRQQVPTEGGRA